MASDRILVILVRAIGLLFRTIPFSWGMRIASWTGSFAFWMDPKRKFIGFSNITQALGDSFSVKERIDILRSLYQNMAISFIEVLRFPELTAAEVAERIEFHGSEHMAPFVRPEREKTFIGLAAHYGNWELMNQAFALCGVALNVITRDQKMSDLNRLLNEHRQLHGSRVIAKGMSLREVFGRLAKKEPIAMLMDQDGGKKGIFTPLFGRLASTKRGAFVISMKTKTPVIPLFIIRDPRKKDRHAIYIEKPFSIPVSETEIPQMIGQYSQLLEKYVRKAPDQWLWLHHRWKSSPIQKVIILSDGKKGHLNQSKAVSEIVIQGLQQEKKAAEEIQTEVIDIRFRSRFRRAIVSLLLTGLPNSIVWRWRVVQWGLEESSFHAVASARGDIVISAGSSLSAVNAWLSKAWHARNVHLMKPNMVSWRLFNRVILPQHDWNKNQSPPKNVILTKITPSLNQETGDRSHETGEKRVGILLGGDNDEYQMRPEWVKQLLQKISASSMRFLVTTSRRTSKQTEDVVVELLKGHSMCDLLEIANRSQQNGVAEKILRDSSVILVTGESLSMVSEAVSSGKPVVVVFPSAKSRGVTKHFRMVRELEKQGFVKVAELDKVSEALSAPVTESATTQKLLNEERERLLAGLRNL